MPEPIRRRLTFANVVSVIALFIALGGSSYAALTIHGSQIEDRSIAGKKLRRNTIGGVTVKESRLGKVRRARRADTLQGRSARQLTVRCSPETIFLSGVCMEAVTRPPAAYGIARLECGNRDRRLPTYEELANLVSASEIDVGRPAELTSSVFVSGRELQIVVVTGEAGEAGVVDDTYAGGRPYRCVAYPSN